jgi:hypothetical protein
MHEDPLRGNTDLTGVVVATLNKGFYEAIEICGFVNEHWSNAPML